MASRLEAATRQYDVHLLLSEDLHTMLTPSLKKICRNIDRVTVKGSAKPIRLFTIDINVKNIELSKKKKMNKSSEEMIDVEIKRDINLQNLEEDKISLYDARVTAF